MAIFQPTNVIPSISTNSGTVSVADTMQVQWQVNGNSAMTAFQIDVYKNDALSTHIQSTGKITDNCPFYGTDRFGKPQFFTYNSGTPWNIWSGFSMTDGNNYKLKITQWYSGGGDEYTLLTEAAMLQGSSYYFSLTTNEGTKIFVNFQATYTFPYRQTIVYNVATKQGYLIIAGNQSPFNSTESSTPIGTNLGVALNDISIVQTSASPFITRTRPTVALQICATDDFTNPTDFSSGELNSSIGYFHAKYEQAQHDPVRWIQWQIASASNGVVGVILADTKDIYTPTLDFEYNGFFVGQEYAIRCLVETENGQQSYVTGANADGWVFFTIKVAEQGSYTGTFTAQCLPKENAALLKWEGVEVINGDYTAPESGEDYTFNNCAVVLPANSSITWNKVGVGDSLEDINFPSPWTVAFIGKISLNYKSESIVVFGMPTHKKVVNGESYWFYESTQIIRSDINKVLAIEVKPYSSSTTYQTRLTTVVGESYITITLLSKTQEVLSADINVFSGEPISPVGEIFSILSNSKKLISISQNSDSTSNFFTVQIGESNNNILIQGLATDFAFIINPKTITAYFYKNENVVYQSSTTISSEDWQAPINSIQINGSNIGCTVESVSVYQGGDSNIADLYNNSTFEPVWNSDSYDLYMTANFNGNVEGGTGTATGTGFQLYRHEVGSTVLTPIANLASTQTQLKDYGISSRKTYQYWLFAYDANQAFMNGVQAMSVNNIGEVGTIVSNFQNYSLMVCSYDEIKDEYHVRKQYLFALNLTDNGSSNNNAPTINANFTPYPTVMKSVQNYKSGTLSGLIGTIYTKQAVIEQIGNYKRTVTPSTLDYFDSVDLEKELYDLSVTPYMLFLRDMKGHLRMVQASGAITQTPYIKSSKQQITISFPWVEIGDAGDVTIIQTPDDYGWDYDNQVLDVQLDVDTSTGELWGTYPYPYSGTKFYLAAGTPIGITPAKFNMSETAENTTDGQVTATVKVNSET